MRPAQRWMVIAWMDRAGWVSLRPVMVGRALVPALDGGNDGRRREMHAL
ncbi:MAG TPA: hypothetical protein VKB50_13345 [Vicinamibacterales bacterium]|nr:hypothetical protein [Vicinamibacterales bacterium]